MPRSSISTLPLVAALALVLAACGGRPDPEDPAANPSTGDGAPAAAGTPSATGGMQGTASPAAGDAATGADADNGVASDAQAGGLTTGTSTWTCDDLTVNIAYDDVADTVTVSHADGTMLLPAHGGDGATRYADDAGNQFQHQGGSAMLSLAGQPSRNCSRS